MLTSTQKKSKIGSIEEMGPAIFDLPNRGADLHMCRTRRKRFCRQCARHGQNQEMEKLWKNIPAALMNSFLSKRFCH